MKIGFIGAGTVTRTFGRHFITAGHTVVVSNSRGPETLTDFVADLTELAPPSNATPEFYDKIFNILAQGTFFTIQKAVPLMTAGGAIVTVGSVAHKKGIPNMTVYSSAKAAVRYSVKGWAAELIGKGIRVNNFSPGVADTPMLDGQHETQEESDAMRAGYIKMTPMGQLGRPEEMASSIFFLASDESSFTTGIDLAADGGLSEF